MYICMYIYGKGDSVAYVTFHFDTKLSDYVQSSSICKVCICVRGSPATHSSMISTQFLLVYL